MLSKKSLKNVYNLTFFLALVLTLASILKFQQFSYILGIIVMFFSILGYQAVNKYYDGFAKSKAGLKKAPKKKTAK